MSLIEASSLTQRFGATEALRGVSLAVQEREMLAIIGPSGSGKTTLLRIMDLLDRPASGSVSFDGREVSPRMRTQVRRQISMVLQKPVVFDASVYDNVAYPLRVRRSDRKAIPDRVNAMLKTVGLDGYQKRRARTLSGGETQKVALARALITGPRLLLLDEPTANLDPVSLNTIEDLILQANRDHGMAIVIATHEMAQGQRLATRIGVMMGGELIEVGRTEDIFYAPGDLRVARFVGVENILRGRIADGQGGLARVDVDGQTLEVVTHRCPGEDVDVCIRPEEVTISIEPASTSARNSLPGRVTLTTLSGPLVRVQIDCGIPLVSLVTRRSAEELGLKAGQSVYASFKASAARVIGAAGASPGEAPGECGHSPAATRGPDDIIPPDASVISAP